MKRDEAKADAHYEKTLKVARKLWGEPRGMQADGLRHVCNGDDLLCVLPTGSGKSLLFQSPFVNSKRPVIVISPLIALIHNQVKQATDRGIRAAYIDSSLSDKAAKRIAQSAEAGEYVLLYVSPERFTSPGFFETLENMNIRAVVVDEVHSVGIDSNTFRGSYAKIGAVVKQLPKRPQMLCFTATLTPPVFRDVCESCDLDEDDLKRVIALPTRPNIRVRSIYGDRGFSPIIDLATRWLSQPGRYIIYTRSRKAADMLTSYIRDRVQRSGGNPNIVGTYHAGMDHVDNVYVDDANDPGLDGEVIQSGRRSTQEAFEKSKIRLVVATTAFGLGVDVPDIRGVALFGVPSRIEEVVQMIGRAGRDGLDSEGVIVTGSKDIGIAQNQMNQRLADADSLLALWANIQRNYEVDEIFELKSACVATRLNPYSNESHGAILEASGLVERVPVMDAVAINVTDIRQLRTALRSGALGRKTRPVAQFVLEQCDSQRKTYLIVRAGVLRENNIDRKALSLLCKKVRSINSQKASASDMVRRIFPGKRAPMSALHKANRHLEATTASFEVVKSFAETGDIQLVNRYFVQPVVDE